MDNFLNNLKKGNGLNGRGDGNNSAFDIDPSVFKEAWTACGKELAPYDETIAQVLRQHQEALKGKESEYKKKQNEVQRASERIVHAQNLKLQLLDYKKKFEFENKCSHLAIDISSSDSSDDEDQDVVDFRNKASLNVVQEYKQQFESDLQKLKYHERILLRKDLMLFKLELRKKDEEQMLVEVKEKIRKETDRVTNMRLENEEVEKLKSELEERILDDGNDELPQKNLDFGKLAADLEIQAENKEAKMKTRTLYLSIEKLQVEKHKASEEDRLKQRLHDLELLNEMIATKSDEIEALLVSGVSEWLEEINTKHDFVEEIRIENLPDDDSY